MSRWANWSTGTEEKKLGFSSFQLIAEAGQPVQGDPEQIIQQHGWQHRGYGYYVDGSGQTVARVQDGQLYMIDGEPNEVDKQVDTGNPTNQASGLKPADRARSMGLQSNGRGGYIDPKTGQTVARTVNNELVFYDQRPGGGAVSDGAGGQKIAQDTPSWQDPVTGLVVTPPAKPESAQEIAAIPDPIPAQSPSGYNKFIQQKKLLAYAKNKIEYDAEQEIQPQQQELQAKYQGTPGMSEVYALLDGAAQRAAASGDPIKMDGGERLKQRIEEDADNFEMLFQNIPDLNPKAVVSQVIKSEKNKAIEAALGEDAPLEEKEAAGYTFTRDLDEFIPELRANMQPQQQDLLPSDDSMPTDEQGGKLHYIDGVDGKVEFELVDDGEVSQDFWDSSEAAGLEQNTDLASFQRNHFTPGNQLTVNWYLKDKNQDSKGAAIDALKTWKREILPELPVGSVITATPSLGNQEQLTRLYGALGFGSVNKSLDLYGIVTVGEDGQKYIQPIGEQSQMDRIREAYLPLAYQEINSEYAEFVEEMLFS